MASSVQSALEQAVSAAGVEISDTPDFETDNTAEAQQTQEQEVPNEVQEPVQQEVPQDIEQPVVETESSLTTEEEEDVDIDSLFLSYYNEKFGVNHDTWEDIQSTPTQQAEPNELPETIKVIADFVAQTGRSPEDWFRYQQLNPSEMDDMTVVRIDLAQQNPDLNQKELELLIDRKYKLDEDRFDTEDVEYSKLQLKLDAKKARQGIEDVRNGYQLPVEPETAQEVQSPIDDAWVSSMSNTVDNMEGLTFDVGKGKEFTFNLEGNYKNQLKDKNSRLDEFFDPYVNDSGDWNHELLSSHRAVIDNIENIVRSAYQHGLGEGQKKIVERAANIDSSSPNQKNQGEGANQIEKQIMNALFKNDGMMRFK